MSFFWNPGGVIRRRGFGAARAGHRKSVARFGFLFSLIEVYKPHKLKIKMKTMVFRYTSLI